MATEIPSALILTAIAQSTRSSSSIDPGSGVRIGMAQASIVGCNQLRGAVD